MTARKRALLVFLFASFLLPGCVLRRRPLGRTAREGRRRVRSYRASKTVELALSPRRGPSPRCGAIAAAMVTKFHGRPLAAKRIHADLMDGHRGGISNRALAAYLRKAGFECYNIHGRMADIEGLLRRRLPPLLVVRTLDKECFHYLVAVGLAKEARLLAVNNPFCGREILTFEELRKAWQPTGNTLLVVAPRTKPIQR